MNNGSFDCTENVKTDGLFLNKGRRYTKDNKRRLVKIKSFKCYVLYGG